VITIVDYGMGNLGSMLNMFKRIGIQARITSDPEDIRSENRLILPGVGAFDAAMSRINSRPGMLDALNHKALIDHIPILGVCLGMQLLTCRSEEGVLPGLGWIEGETKKFPVLDDLKVPHMGWNIAKTNTPSFISKDIGSEFRFYFVHSYCVHVSRKNDSLMTSRYGIDFDSAIGHENIFGVQFHPEKSHRFGMQVLKNFANL
jgi:glutamine amidotransferase